MLVLAGAYQLTPMKAACLRACRSSLALMGTHALRAGGSAAVWAGVSYGAMCLGSCWALMAVLAVLGLMKLVWMAVFCAVFFLEKAWRQGVRLARIVGAACVILGLAVTIRPDILQLLGAPMAG